MYPASSTIRQIQRRYRSLSKLSNIAVRAGKQITTSIEQNAIHSLTNGFLPSISQPLIRKNLPVLSRLMTASNLRGRLDVRQEANRVHKPLALDLDPVARLDDVIRELGQALNVNLASLEAQYDIVALRVLLNVSDNVEQAIRKFVYGQITEGATVRTAVEEMGGLFDRLGLTKKNSYQLETIYRTASGVAYGAGTWQAFADPDIQEILWGFQYSAVMDDRTRLNHAAAEGVTLPKDDSFWQTMWPPNGYNCRCVPIPLFSAHELVFPTPEAHPDKGFGFNSGIIVGQIGIGFSHAA